MRCFANKTWYDEDNGIQITEGQELFLDVEWLCDDKGNDICHINSIRGEDDVDWV